jgi:hypothetical protein
VAKAQFWLLCHRKGDKELVGIRKDELCLEKLERNNVHVLVMNDYNFLELRK